MNQNPPPVEDLSPEYHKKLQDDLKHLEVYREEVLVRLQSAREKGDLSENGAYTAARFELGDTDRKLRKVRYLLKYGRVVKAKHTSTVSFGSKVTLLANGKSLTYTIVSKHESDPLKHKLSIDSPLGTKLIGMSKGDSATINAPAGQITYLIEKID